MTDIVERLRGDVPEKTIENHRGCFDYQATLALMREAADEIEDWKDNYNKATDACVALRAENARLRERLRFDDEEPYAHIDSLQAENTKLREALERIADSFDGETGDAKIARAALQKDEG